MDIGHIENWLNQVILNKPNVFNLITEVYYKIHYKWISTQNEKEKLILFYKKDWVRGIPHKYPHFFEMSESDFYILNNIIDNINATFDFKEPVYKIPGILDIKPFIVNKFLFFYVYKSIDEDGDELIHFSPYKTQIITWVNDWIKSIEENPEIWNENDELEYRIYLAKKIVHEIKTSL